MIWKVIGTIGAGSFFVNGLSILSDPTCISADFGGGRVVQVTCRDDSYGTFSGAEAGFVSLLIGSLLLVVVFFSQIKRLLKNPTYSPYEHQDSKLKPEALVSIKFCENCKNTVDMDLQECSKCKGTYFSFKKVLSKSLPDLSATSEAEPTQSQSKKCPMCAEDIRIEALKCRFCQHSFVESGLKKFESSISDTFRTAFSQRFAPITVTLIILGLIGIGIGMNERSKSIEKNQLITSGEICVESADGSTKYGCADYPRYDFEFCSRAPFSDMYFTDEFEIIGDSYKAGQVSTLCSGANSYLYTYEGTTNKLKGEYEISVWDYTKPDYLEGDMESGGYFKMKIGLKN
jgi:hypothetical protein